MPLNRLLTLYLLTVLLIFTANAYAAINKLALDAHYNSHIYQDIITTPNTDYTLELAYSPRVPNRSNSDPVEVWWDGQHLATLNSNQKHWQPYQWQVTATSDTTRLELRGAGKSDSVGGLIDNVRLHQHPQSSETQTAIYYYHNDHLGTPQALTDKDQNIVWQAHYHPFGQTTLIINTIENNIRFPGQYYDQETGLYYNWNRYYDPELGRYITSDPIGLAGGMNTYVYAYQNPLNYSDPDGRIACGGACIAAVGYAVVELGLSAWDAYDTYNTVTDDCSSTGEKLTAGGLFVAGALLPGGGYSQIDDVVGGIKDLKPTLKQENPRNLIPTQTKSEMSGSQIKRLAKDMKHNGFDQSKPVDAWQNPQTGRLEIQDGHHRTEAAKKAGLDKIPVQIWR